MSKLLILIFLACSLPLAFANIDDSYNYSDNYFDNKVDYEFNLNRAEKIKAEQDEIAKKIQQEYASGNYTISNPYIKINPYQHNPLSALVKFETQVATKVKLTVKSRTGNPDDDINAVFPAKKVHDIKVLALHDNYLNEVLLETDLGNNTIYLQTIKTGEDKYKTKIYDFSKLLPVSYLFFNNRAVAHDRHGNPRLRFLSLPFGFMRQVNKDIFQKGGLKINGFGRILEIYEMPTRFHHDLFVLPNNKGVLIFSGLYDVYLSKDNNLTKLFDFRELVTPDDEKINYQAICTYSKAAETHWCKRKDWFHSNSLWYQEEDNSLIVSLRTLLAVIKVSLDDNKIKWIFGPGLEIFKGLDDYKLTPMFSDKMLYNYGQHQVSVLQNGNILMFNNRDWIQNLNSLWQVPKYASGDEYKINEEQKTIEHVRSYGLDKKITVQTSGGAQGLPGNKRLVLFPNKIVDEKRINEAQYALYDNEGNEITEGFLPNYNYRVMAYDVYQGLSG